MFGFFGLDPIHWVIIAVMGLLCFGTPITIIVLLIMLARKKGGEEQN
jgi:hypothetical protein